MELPRPASENYHPHLSRLDWWRANQVNPTDLFFLKAKITSRIGICFPNTSMTENLCNSVSTGIARSCAVINETDFLQFTIKVDDQMNALAMYGGTCPPIITFSRDILDAAYREIHLIKKYGIADGGLGELRECIAHEIYHHRQSIEDPTYYAQTSKTQIHNGASYSDYDMDRGEMAATAFSLRTLLEESHSIKSQPNADKFDQMYAKSMKLAYDASIDSLTLRGRRMNNLRKMKKEALTKDPAKSGDA